MGTYIQDRIPSSLTLTTRYGRNQPDSGPNFGLGLVGYGTAQWLVLRRHVSRAGRYAATSIAGLVAAAVGSTLLGMLFGDFAGSGFGGGIWGAVYGAVTGRGPIVAATRPPQETP